MARHPEDAEHILARVDDASARKARGYSLGEPVSFGTLSLDVSSRTAGAAADVSYDRTTPTGDDLADQAVILLADGRSTFAPDDPPAVEIPEHPPWRSSSWTGALDGALLVLIGFMRPPVPSKRAHRRLFRPNRPEPRSCATCGRPFVPLRSDGRFCQSACRQKAYRGRVTDSSRISRRPIQGAAVIEPKAPPIVYTATLTRIRPGDPGYDAALRRLQELADRDRNHLAVDTLQVEKSRPGS